ncbi:hypothetical protein [Evansella halocellulosilytica]|uniref:hypothetical protein n=1 Tax=Evansella halocellulosilytica TaxID=2011013 RepID=UPI000BB84182|nr:hypothetical protein [Evansella halocellulosilytica]
MKKGDVVWFKGYRKARVIRVDGEKVMIRFMSGVGNERAIVRREKVFTNESARAKKEREEIEKEMRIADGILRKLKNDKRPKRK